jgi:hypothetical protein
VITARLACVGPSCTRSIAAEARTDVERTAIDAAIADRTDQAEDGYRCTDPVLGPPCIELQTTRADLVHEGADGCVARPEVVRRSEH